MSDPTPDLDQVRRTSMAAERTWLAWWRTALAASAGALAVGRLAPELLQGAQGPHIVLRCGYAAPGAGPVGAGGDRPAGRGRDAPARPRARAAHGRPRAAAVPHGRGVHRRRHRARGHDD